MDKNRPPKFLARAFGAHCRPHGQRGLALVTVLWVLVLLALMAASFIVI